MKTKTNCKAGCPTAVEKPKGYYQKTTGMRVKSGIQAGRGTSHDADGSV